MSAHTPGPWAAADRVVVTTGSAYTWIADCAVGGSDKETQIANARLIAAALKMLDALKAADAAMDAMSDPLSHGLSDVEMARLWNAVRDKIVAAIAKATGEDAR